MSNFKAGELIVDLVKLNTKIQKHVGGSLSIHGLSLSDYFVLNQLFISPNKTLRRSDLAESVGLTPSGITRLLNPLEKIGLVKKEANVRDARVSLVALTRAGTKAYQDASSSFSASSDSLFESQSSSQMLKFAQTVKKLKTL